jgi:hypothetical protein
VLLWARLLLWVLWARPLVLRLLLAEMLALGPIPLLLASRLLAVEPM